MADVMTVIPSRQKGRALVGAEDDEAEHHGQADNLEQQDDGQAERHGSPAGPGRRLSLPGDEYRCLVLHAVKDRFRPPGSRANGGRSHVQKRYRKHEGVLFEEAPDAAPRGVLGENDYQDIEKGDRDDGQAAEGPDQPVARAITPP